MRNFFYSLSTRGVSVSLCLIISIGFATNSRALEVLTLQEFVDYCKQFKAEPESTNGQYCLHYIQGFIDGAIETDMRILNDLDNNSKSTIIDRAMKTRLPKRADDKHSGHLAGFCLDDPLPLRQVVNIIVTDLIALDKSEKSRLPARIAVDDALRRHYPCGE